MPVAPSAPVERDEAELDALARRIAACPTEPISLAELAAYVGLSPRSVQRKLARARTSYRALVDAARRRTALERVAGSDDSLTRIAMDLGYLDSGSFTRAFRRWTGLSPREYRMRISRLSVRPQTWTADRRGSASKAGSHRSELLEGGDAGLQQSFRIG